MAWFDHAAQADVPQPVTMDRVRALFDRNQWPYLDVEQKGVLGTFYGFMVMIHLPEFPFLTITVLYPDPPIDGDRYLELLEWAEDGNREGLIGACQVEGVPGDEDFVALSNHTILVAHGATEEQLQEWIEACIEAQAGNLARLCLRFDIGTYQTYATGEGAGG